LSFGPVLLDIQNGRCFYCRLTLTPASTQVDHFVAWARYPVDLGHNFVLADSKCNRRKLDRLPACEHLALWTERNARFGDQIAEGLTRQGIISELTASNCVERWAYGQLEQHLVAADQPDPALDQGGWRGFSGRHRSSHVSHWVEAQW